MSKMYIGKENGKIAFDKSKKCYYVYWFDSETLKRKTTSYARWYWEINRGEIPEGYRASYRDKNPLNIDPDNIILISPEEFGGSISERLIGHTFSDETLEKMSKAKLGKSLSEEHKNNIGKSTKQMWKNGVFDTLEIREAYSKQGKSTKGIKRTEEQKQKMKESRKGHKFPDKAYSKESLEKRRNKLIGKTQSEEANKKRSEAQKGKIFSDEHLEKLSIAVKDRIKNGTHNFIKQRKANSVYPPEFSIYFKRKIRRRDGYICQSCGENVYRSPIGHVHHIDGNKQNCSEDNLLLLCATCHNAVHGRNNITSPKIEELKSKLTY